MTSSIFWGIWPYGLPYCRFYSHLVKDNFQYVYEPYDIDSYVKFLRKKSTIFQRYMAIKEAAKANPMTKERLEKDWDKRHCENYVRNPKLLMEHFLYHITDYDHVMDLYL